MRVKKRHRDKNKTPAQSIYANPRQQPKDFIQRQVSDKSDKNKQPPYPTPLFFLSILYTGLFF